MSLEGSIIKEEEIDRLVLGWLKRRKLDQSLNALQMELNKGGRSLAVAEEEAWRNRTAVTTILHASLEDATGKPYVDQYKLFSVWVDRSLDMYRAELLRLLYLVMIYTYVHLVFLGEGPSATSMLAESKDIFLAGLPPPSKKVLETELSELAKVTTPEQLDTDNLAKEIRSQTKSVRLSHTAYSMLLDFLRQNEYTLILGLINQWIKVIVSDGDALLQKEEGILSAGFTGTGIDSRAINQNPINVRLLKDSAAHIYEIQKVDQAEIYAAEKAADDTGTKKQKALLQKEADKARQQKVAAHANAFASRIPLLPVPEEQCAAWVEEFKFGETAGADGKPVSADALPSAAFFTFMDTEQSLNCSALAKQKYDKVVAGFSDASVRLYTLAQPDHDDNGAAHHQRQSNIDRPLRLSGHTGAVHAVDFSSDDQLIASSSADGTVRLWSTELVKQDVSCLVVYKGHMLPVWDVAFSPEYGPYFATGGADRAARIWVTERSQALRVLSGHKSDVDVVRWHPNCQYIATGSSDTSVRMWDVRDGGCIRAFEGHTSAITTMAFSSDGSTLATGDASGAVRIWDISSARCLATSKEHQGPVWSLSYSNGNGKLLASGGNDCTLRLWGEAKSDTSVASNNNNDSVDGLKQLATWNTKKTPVVMAMFTRSDLLMAAGPLSFN